MKDIIISKQRIRKELITLLICFIIAFLTNVIAVAVYKTPWYEIFSQIGYVVVIAVALYLILFAIRGAIHLFRRVLGKNKLKQS